MSTKFYLSLVSRSFKGQGLESKQERLNSKRNASSITLRK